jgi:hypothetical protein
MEQERWMRSPSAIFRDEAPYVLEWLVLHRMIGGDLFVRYDNGSSDGGADLIRT